MEQKPTSVPANFRVASIPRVIDLFRRLCSWLREATRCQVSESFGLRRKHLQVRRAFTKAELAKIDGNQEAFEMWQTKHAQLASEWEAMAESYENRFLE